MKVLLLSHTENAEEICAASARSCYSPRTAHEQLGIKDPESILEQIIDMGHHSVLEHASFTFSVSGVSRTLTHQLVRHRLASYSQQSQRYVSMDSAEYIVPPSIRDCPEALTTYSEGMRLLWDCYRCLAELVPKEDARYVLPNACETNIVITMNARELIHFFALRCCERAQWEIRALAESMLSLCQQVCPTIFKKAGAPCTAGDCPEGKKSCGRIKNKEVKE